mmetsp:Transcript_7873/g.15236  ORF Transcript_7873/g.15236 Transcript_7873/m.15236 type:complete len:306 (+) Transcript_7873:3056-3973(+)
MSDNKPSHIHTTPLPLPIPSKDGKRRWHLVTGGVAGAVSRTLTSPLERIKILRQCQTAEYSSLSMMQIFKAISAKEGWKGFFKGNGTNVIRVVPFSAIEFYSFEVYKGYILSKENPRNKLRVLMCGSLAGITASLLTYPLDITRTYLTVQTDIRNSSFVKSIRLIHSNHGFAGFYRGILITLAGIAPYIGFKMTTFDILKGHYMPDPSSPSFMLVNLYLGAVSATVAATLTYPTDLLRRRIQMIAFDQAHQLPYTNIWGCVGHIWKTEGYRGFFKGLAACYLKAIPSVAIAFACNEQLKKWLSLN